MGAPAVVPLSGLQGSGDSSLIAENDLRRADSNCKPQGYEPCELPDYSTPQLCRMNPYRIPERCLGDPDEFCRSLEAHG